MVLEANVGSHAPDGAATTVDVHDSFVLQPEDGAYLLTIELPTSIDTVMLQSEVHLDVFSRPRYSRLPIWVLRQCRACPGFVNLDVLQALLTLCHNLPDATLQLRLLSRRELPARRRL